MKIENDLIKHLFLLNYRLPLATTKIAMAAKGPLNSHKLHYVFSHHHQHYHHHHRITHIQQSVIQSVMVVESGESLKFKSCVDCNVVIIYIFLLDLSVACCYCNIRVLFCCHVIKIKQFHFHTIFNRIDLNTAVYVY